MNEIESSNLSQAKGQEEIRKIESPLSAAAGIVDPRSLDALMAEDVERLTDPDVDRIVSELRRQREIWARNEAAQQAKPKGRAGASKGNISVDLNDIGL